MREFLGQKCKNIKISQDICIGFLRLNQMTGIKNWVKVTVWVFKENLYCAQSAVNGVYGIFLWP